MLKVSLSDSLVRENPHSRCWLLQRLKDCFYFSARGICALLTHHLSVGHTGSTIAIIIILLLILLLRSVHKTWFSLVLIPSFSGLFVAGSVS